MGGQEVTGGDSAFSLRTLGGLQKKVPYVKLFYRRGGREWLAGQFLGKSKKRYFLDSKVCTTTSVWKQICYYFVV